MRNLSKETLNNIKTHSNNNIINKTQEKTLINHKTTIMVQLMIGVMVNLVKILIKL